MKVSIRVGELDKYIWTIKVLSLLGKPFSELRPREVEVLAYLYMVYNRYAKLGKKEANTLTFDKGIKKEISEKLNITLENLYNILSNLRRNGIIDDNGIIKVVSPVSNITIEFVDK